MRHVLLTGATGCLGWNFCRVAQDRVRVTAAVHRHAPDRPGIRNRHIELASPERFGALLDSVRPDAVIHAAALAQPNACERDPAASFRINVEASAALARECAARDLAFLLTSTDLVFDGEQAPYREEAVPAPLQVYGRHKAEAERRVLDAHPGAAICRLPLLFGDPGPYAGNFLTEWLGALETGRVLNCFTDEFRTAVSAPAAAEGLLLVLERGVGGILHLGGRERLSRHAFALRLAHALGCATAAIRPCRRADLPMPALRPRDLSLDSRRAFALGYDPPPPETEFRRLRPGLRSG
ncbi:MAG: SDR family oxidoreductase [Lentisphaerae bacterium]|nr:SDR family oxidoreductase [Lentisphaerota bacterium]